MASSPGLRVVTGRRARRRLRIVVGLDGSELSLRLLQWCASLAVLADVEVVAVHALEARTYPPEFRRDLPRASDRTHQSWRDEIRARIDSEWCTPLHISGLHRRVIVGDGRPHSVLARAARRYEADLVLVGNRPRGALVEAFRPGVARRLGGLAPCPVVTIAAGNGDAPAPHLERILVASDGGAASGAAVGWAAGLAADLGVELVAARVIAAATPAPAPAAGSERRPRVVDDVTAALEAELAALGPRVPVRRRAAVLVGDTAAMLLALAESEAAGLVVIGAGALHRLRPGSGGVVTALTRSAPCPVVTVAAAGNRIDTGTQPSRRTTDMTSETHRPRGVRFAAGTAVSPGEYRNCDTGSVRYFDGTTPLPGGVNSASWQQVSDHYHPVATAIQPEQRHTMPDTTSRPVRFAAGTLVSPGEYRNCDSGKVQYFDGTTPLPGGINAASWQQVSDHHHPQVPERT